jgi:serine/threonine protein kinase
MPEIDADIIVDQIYNLGLVAREEIREATADAPDGSAETAIRMLLRKGLVTSWQVDRLKKGDMAGFFYGESKALFHLAEGTFARVYRGVHVASRNPVAIKVLRQRFALVPDAVTRFHKEAEAGMRLAHENIVRILDVGHADTRHFMIMEYVEGMNLRDFLRLRGRLKASVAVPLMLGLANGMKYSLNAGVTHRDIKGTNILVSNSGVAKLVDFGLATIEGEEKKSGVQSQRTVDYSALERTCRSPKGDHRSDIYFLGCVFYQMLTGQLPMEESESKDPLKKMLVRSFGAIKPLSDHPYAPDEGLSAIIEKMMKIDLKARYQTMDQVVEDLDNFLASKAAQPESMDQSAASAAQSGPKFNPETDLASIFASHEFASPARIPEPEVEPEPSPAHFPISQPEQPEPSPEPDPLDALFTEDAASTGEEPANLSFETPTFVPKSVLCVESQAEIQDALRKTLSKMGYRVLLVSDAQMAAERYRESPVDAVIFDLDGQDEEALAALEDMHDKGVEDEHRLVALVLLGHRQGDIKEKLPTGDRLRTLIKPIKMKEVQDAILELLPLQ